MTDAWLIKWEERYRQETYAFGIAPNAYFQQEVSKLELGAILLAAAARSSSSAIIWFVKLPKIVRILYFRTV